MGRQQHISSILVEHRLWFLRYLSRMSESHLPKKLLVCAPVADKHQAGGQKVRWNELVQRDLKLCGLESDWRDSVQDRLGWRSEVKMCVEDLNRQVELKEKKRCEERLQLEDLALHCSFPGCTFVASNKAGLVNHTRQKHSQPQMTTCQFCSCPFRLQGFYNHEIFCRHKPQ